MNQEMGWFDRKENSIGALSARLSGDAASVQGAIGFPLSNIIQAFTNFICSIAIAFPYSWELALICLSTSPFMVASIVFEARFGEKSALKEKEVLEETSRIATETITQIRTVAGLRREEELIKIYDKEVERYRHQILSRLKWRGLVNSLGKSLMFFGYAVTLTYGGHMCADGKIKFETIMKWVIAKSKTKSSVKYLIFQNIQHDAVRSIYSGPISGLHSRLQCCSSFRKSDV